jgi:hypothetical protein
MEQDSFDVPEIDAAERLQGSGRHENEGKKKKQEHHPPLKKNAGAYFHTLSKAAEAANELCTKKSLPYRFRVYLENGEAIIDRTILDKDGNILEVKTKNINQEDFARLIEDVTSIEGLFFDTMA